MSSSVVSLNALLEATQVVCLNESSAHSLQSLLKGGFLESDSDEQLLLTIPTMQPINLHSLKIVTSPSALAQAPKILRLFVNQRNLSFDDAESNTPAQEITLTEKQMKGEDNVILRFVKFQRISTVSIFVQSNNENAETTRIDELTLYGSPAETSDMKNFNKGDDDGPQ